jgi:dGTPase
MTALARYASDPARSRGRRVAEPASPPRTDYQRDRDRVVHSTAFRRLVYKTQVFINHEGDLYRTRLTHSLEVAQIARSIARALSLNEDLVEAIALAHDLGHTPFGHAGQDALDACMKPFGGFEHNLQSLRVVDRLEQRYPTFDGLNLTFETREGILKHCTKAVAERIEVREPNGVAARFLHGGQPSLEAQLCNLADEVAYAAHDIDDGVRSGLLDLRQLGDVPLVSEHVTGALAQFPHLSQAPERRLLAETLRRMLSAQVNDLADASQRAVQAFRPADDDDVRRAPPLVQFSPEMRERAIALKRFLFANLYRHPRVERTTARARDVLQALFQIYRDAPREMPEEHRLAFDRAGPRAVSDYIAGMTDRFAVKEFQRLTGAVAFEGD